MVLSFLVLLSSNTASWLGIFVLKKLVYSSEYSDCFEELYSNKKQGPLRLKLLLYGTCCTHYPVYLIIANGFENQLMEIMNQTMVAIIGWNSVVV